MTVVVVGDPPAELEMWLHRRRVLGQDRFDEVWDGVYHVVPAPRQDHGNLDHQLAALLLPAARRVGLHGTTAFNLGEARDYRVPDGGYHRRVTDDVYVGTCAIVVEIVSPRDETYQKFGFYAERGVDELIVVDSARRSVQLLMLRKGGYVDTDSSPLLGVLATELVADLIWP